jgi:hypothetical protein
MVVEVRIEVWLVLGCGDLLDEDLSRHCLRACKRRFHSFATSRCSHLKVVPRRKLSRK